MVLFIGIIKNKVDLFSKACKFTDEQIAETQKKYQLKYPNDPLFVLRKLLHYILFTFFDDTKNRELTEIFFHKCELIGEMAQFAELRREIYMINHQQLVTLLSACVKKIIACQYLCPVRSNYDTSSD